MGRIYTAPFVSIAVTVVQDLWELLLPSDLVVLIHAIELTQRTSTTSEILSVSLKLIPLTVTSGSGGGTITPSKNDEGDITSSVTVERNNTTRASSSGSIETKRQWDWNIIPGLHKTFTPDMRPVLSPSSTYVVGLEIAPGTSMNISGVLTYEEIGG